MDVKTHLLTLNFFLTSRINSTVSAELVPRMGKKLDQILVIDTLSEYLKQQLTSYKDINLQFDKVAKNLLKSIMKFLMKEGWKLPA